MYKRQTLDSLGELSEAQERWDEAAQWFASALEIYLAIHASYALVTTRNLARVRRSSAGVLMGQNRLDEAARQLDSAEALEPDAPDLALRRAELAKVRGDRADAAHWAQEALRRQSDWDEAESILAWAAGS